MSTSAPKFKVMILGGPNLGRLGLREPDIYGRMTWEELEERCRSWAEEFNLEIDFVQDDGEGALVGLIHQASDQTDGLILNAAAYTHTSVAIRDAVAAVGIPVIEIHLTNPTAREEFRQSNLLAGVVNAGVFGFGINGYRLAIEGMAGLLSG